MSDSLRDSERDSASDCSSWLVASLASTKHSSGTKTILEKERYENKMDEMYKNITFQTHKFRMLTNEYQSIC